MDEPSSQLHQNLKDTVGRTLASRRPVLTHLNADTTWLLQLPYPYDIVPPRGRSYFNILIDPWLKGSQVDVASWFSKQWHSTKSSVMTIMELNEQLREIDKLSNEQVNRARIYERECGESIAESFIDVVIISHEFTDHCHKDTLFEVQPNIPIFATKTAADLIRSWKRFNYVREIPNFSEKDLDWTKTSQNPLPKWLGISRLVTETDPLYFHSAILIAFNLGFATLVDNQAKGETSEAVIYSPHGIHAQDLRHLPLASPPFQTLALLHGLHDITIGNIKKLNLGAHNGLRALRICKAKYWISTHDEEKEARGIIASLLRRKIITVQEAKEHQGLQSADKNLIAEQVKCVRLGSGDSLILS